MRREITSNLGDEEHSTEAKGCENDNKREGLAEDKQVTSKNLHGYLWILIPNGILSLKLQSYSSAQWLE